MLPIFSGWAKVFDRIIALDLFSFNCKPENKLNFFIWANTSLKSVSLLKKSVVLLAYIFILRAEFAILTPLILLS